MDRILSRMQTIYKPRTRKFQCLVTPIIWQIPSRQAAPVNNCFATKAHTVSTISLTMASQKFNRDVGEANASMLHHFHLGDAFSSVDCEAVQCLSVGRE